MLNAVAAFGGGIWVQNRLNQLPIPSFSRAVDEGASFKLSVKVLAASIPGLSDPGLLTRERPRVEVVLNTVRKETEFGDFKPDNAWARVGSSPEAGKAANPGKEGSSSDKDGQVVCPWCFGETLTLVAHNNDVLGPGLQVWVRTQSDVRFGPLQMNLSRPTDVGMCSVDLRRVALPACVPKGKDAETGAAGAGAGPATTDWESPPMVFPLTHVGGGNKLGDKVFVLGESAGHVALSFSVNADPVALLRAADTATQPLVSRVTMPFVEWTMRTANVAASAAQATQTALQEPVRWVMSASELAGCRSVEPDSYEDNLCGDFCDSRSTDRYQRPTMVRGSDLSPGGWISHQGPNGRTFWHHASLGPAPWAQLQPQPQPQLQPQVQPQLQVQRSQSLSDGQPTAAEQPRKQGFRSSTFSQLSERYHQAIPRLDAVDEASAFGSWRASDGTPLARGAQQGSGIGGFLGAASTVAPAAAAAAPEAGAPPGQAAAPPAPAMPFPVKGAPAPEAPQGLPSSAQERAQTAPAAQPAQVTQERAQTVPATLPAQVVQAAPLVAQPQGQRTAVASAAPAAPQAPGAMPAPALGHATHYVVSAARPGLPTRQSFQEGVHVVRGYPRASSQVVYLTHGVPQPQATSFRIQPEATSFRIG